jgi:hypothetical protein
MAIDKVNASTYNFSINPTAAVEIGDINETHFAPIIKIEKWDEDVWLKIIRPTVKEISPTEITVDNEIQQLKWVDTDEDNEFYPIAPAEGLENGGFEFAVILKSKPASNVLEFDIDYNNIEFWYQSPYDEQPDYPEDIAAGVVTKTATQGLDADSNVIVDMPENVVKSYAVYKVNRLTGLSAKVGHIFRPELTDDNGDKIWADLNINTITKKMTITIDQTYLDNAVYPVLVDPTFGYNVLGGTGFNNNEVILGIVANPGEDGTVQTLHAGVDKGWGSGDNIKMALYTEGGTLQSPQSVERSEGHGTTGWVDFNVSGGVSVSDQNYVVAFWSDSVIKIQRDSGGPSGTSKQVDATYGTWPSSVTFVDSTNFYSTYASYDAFSSSSESSLSSESSESSLSSDSSSLSESSLSSDSSFLSESSESSESSSESSESSESSYESSFSLSSVSLLSSVSSESSRFSESSSSESSDSSWLLGTPIIQSMSSTVFLDAVEDVVIDGHTFEASQQTGKVEICDSSDYASGNKNELVVNSWADGYINVNMSFGSLTSVNAWIFVTNDSGSRSPGYPVSLLGFSSSSESSVSSVSSQSSESSNIYGGDVIEMASMRDEKSKSYYDAGTGRFVTDVYMGAIHYKEDYDDINEEWRDVDLTQKDMGTYYLVDKGPNIIKLYKNSTKYEMQSRKTGHKMVVELDGAEPDPSDVEFTYEVQVDKVRLWKTIKTAQGLIDFTASKFRVKEYNKQDKKWGSLRLKEENIDAYDDDNNIVEVSTNKTIVDSITSLLELSIDGAYTPVGDGNKGSLTPIILPVTIDADVDEQVTGSTDDCYDVDDENFSLTSDRFNAGNHSGANTDYLSAARFQSVAIPGDATIDTAYLTLRCSTEWTGTECFTKLSGQDSDNAAAFVDRTDYDARPRTTAQVDWDISTVWSVDSDYNSDEIKTIIQEIIDRDGWSSGNDLVIFWENDASAAGANNLRRAYSYDGSATYAPKLHVEYTPFSSSSLSSLSSDSSIDSQSSSSVSSNASPSSSSVSVSSDSSLSSESSELTASNWGKYDSDATDVADHTTVRYMGGTSPAISDMVAKALWYRSEGSGTISIAMYTGGALDDPTGATRQRAVANQSVSAGWNRIPITDFDWGSSTITWVGWTFGGGAGPYYESDTPPVSSAVGGDWQLDRGRWNQTDPSDYDEATLLPTSPGAGSFDDFWYNVYIEYDIGSSSSLSSSSDSSLSSLSSSSDSLLSSLSSLSSDSSLSSLLSLSSDSSISAYEGQTCWGKPGGIAWDDVPEGFTVGALAHITSPFGILEFYEAGAEAYGYTPVLKTLRAENFISIIDTEIKDTYVIEVRGSATLFSKGDGSPSWEVYSTSMNRLWRYVQIRVRVPL